MDTSLDQQQQQPRFKHFCKICKRGFGCGRALGGHMRAHGIGDENGHIEDNDTIRDWEDKFGGNPPPGTKCMYVLRTNPNRLKSCRICENCGKEFSSWKSFLEHGKCRSAYVESFMSSPRSDDEDEGLRGNGWSKGKRSKRGKVGSFVSNCPLSEDEDLANCLVMLSTARVDPLIAETKESCASARKEDERQNPLCTMPPIFDRGCNNKATNKDVPKGMFECKACKKVFNSHQALGGHRASHKKVKGCYAAKLDDVVESAMGEDVITNDGHSFLSKSTSVGPLESTSQPQLATNSRKKSKIHECTICHRIFLSGQALGGHKRCHWQTSNSPVTSSIAKFHPIQEYNQNIDQKPTFEKTASLDLNLPAPADNWTGVPEDHQNPLNFQVLPEVYLQPWIAMQGIEDNDNHGNTINTVIDSSMLSMEDGTNGKVKLAKLSDLKDIRIGNGSSPWLQVGIGSTSNLSNKTLSLN